jgi:uncharacterized protein YndB with AHSA1/START domain
MSAVSTDRIEKHVLLRAPRIRVWRALTDAEQFGTWFGVKFDGPFTLGKPLHGVIVATKVDPVVAKAQEPYEGMPFDITVERIEPETLFASGGIQTPSSAPWTIPLNRQRWSPSDLKTSRTESC